MANGSRQGKTTTDHEEIRRLAEERGARPVAVKRAGDDEDAGIIRIDLPGTPRGETTEEEMLEEISWEVFFEKFDEGQLAVFCEETVDPGRPGGFRLIDRETAVAAPRPVEAPPEPGPTPEREALNWLAAGEGGGAIPSVKPAPRKRRVAAGKKVSGKTRTGTAAAKKPGPKRTLARGKAAARRGAAVTSGKAVKRRTVAAARSRTALPSRKGRASARPARPGARERNRRRSSSRRTKRRR